MDRQVRQGLSAFAFAALAATTLCAACEGPPWPAQGAGPTAANAPLDERAPAVDDAGPRVRRPFHTMILAQCARDAEECGRARATVTGAPAYLVAFGTGVGSTRTREQAMADLYRELRDRVASGTHLEARPRHLDEAEGGAQPVDETEARRGGPVESDPLVEASFELMAAVDREGEITLDVAPANGTCKLGLGFPDGPDAGASQQAPAAAQRCFLKDEERRSGRGR